MRLNAKVKNCGLNLFQREFKFVLNLLDVIECEAENMYLPNIESNWNAFTRRPHEVCLTKTSYFNCNIFLYFSILFNTTFFAGNRRILQFWKRIKLLLYKFSVLNLREYSCRLSWFSRSYFFSPLYGLSERELPSRIDGTFPEVRAGWASGRFTLEGLNSFSTGVGVRNMYGSI